MADKPKLPNTRGKFVVEYEAADILNLIDVYRLGAATAFTYSRRGDASRNRFDQLAEKIIAISPLPKSNRSEGYAWFDACQKLKDASLYEAFDIETDFTFQKDKRNIVLDVDGRRHVICEDIPIDEVEECLPRLNDFLDEVAGINAVRFQRIQVLAPIGDYKDWWAKSEKERHKMSTAFVRDLVGETDMIYSVRSSRLEWRHPDKGGHLVEMVLAVHPSEVKAWHDKFAELSEDADTYSAPTP